LLGTEKTERELGRKESIPENLKAASISEAKDSKVMDSMPSEPLIRIESDKEFNDFTLEEANEFCGKMTSELADQVKSLRVSSAENQRYVVFSALTFKG
jgi:hypothetical protein